MIENYFTALDHTVATILSFSFPNIIEGQLEKFILCSALPINGSDSASGAKTIELLCSSNQQVNRLLCQLANPKYHQCQIIHQRISVLWTIPPLLHSWAEPEGIRSQKRGEHLNKHLNTNDLENGHYFAFSVPCFFPLIV